jgi:1-acyl-sn-glycerol-3-phosphate acyltransferase
MKHLISFYCWTVGGLYFFVLCIVTILLTFVLSPRRIDPWLKRRLRFLFKLLFIPVKSSGAEVIKPDQHYLFMANHVSLFDIPLFAGYIPTFVRGVEALRQFKWPLYGWAIRRLGNIPIDRKNIHASIKSMKITENELRQGQSILILPEGHRTLDGNLRPFKKLPFHLAKEAGVPIIPIGTSGLFDLKHKGSWLIRPHTVKIKFGEPIPAEKIRDLSREELSDCVRVRIENLID